MYTNNYTNLENNRTANNDNSTVQNVVQTFYHPNWLISLDTFFDTSEWLSNASTKMLHMTLLFFRVVLHKLNGISLIPETFGIFDIPYSTKFERFTNCNFIHDQLSHLRCLVYRIMILAQSFLNKVIIRQYLLDCLQFPTVVNC